MKIFQFEAESLHFTEDESVAIVIYSHGASSVVSMWC